MNLNLSMIKFLGIATIASVAIPFAAIAADTSEPPKKTKTTTECTNGQVWDEATNECVDPQDSHLIDDALFRAARELAYDQQYDNALKVLAAMGDQSDPRVLNYKGFVLRKTGQFEQGLAYYQKALTVDPDYHLARSYMGQGYAEDGQLVLAYAQLVEIRNRGGKGTWAYRELEKSLFEGSTY